MKEPLILTIDFGTQSVRAGLYNKKGEVVGLVKKEYNPPYFSPKPGYAEQDPYYYYNIMCEATRELSQNNKDKLNNILGITMCCFRDSVVATDKDFKPLRPAIIWLDERRAEGKFKLPKSSRLIFKLVGMGPTIDLNMKRSMAQWIRENEPEIWAKTEHFMMISTFVNYQLLGKYVDSPSCQAGHLPIDFKHMKWYESDKHLKGQIFGVPHRMLCELVKPGEVMGTITEKSSKDTGLPVGLKVFASGSDKSAETLGLGVINDKTASISYGTASTIEVPIKKYSDAEPFLPSYPAIIKNCYNMDVQVYRGYWMLNWFAKEFGKETYNIETVIKSQSKIDQLNEAMLKINPGSDGLVLQPYWGPGLRRPLAKGAIIGFSEIHTNVHLYRAIIEGIAYCLREGLELFERRRLHHKIKSLRIAGGGSQSDAICQITADIFGLPVSRIQTYECSSLGCAVAGFLAAGEFKDEEEAAAAMVHKSKEFIPNMDNHKKYDYLYKNVYVKMYPHLYQIYRNLKNFSKFED